MLIWLFEKTSTLRMRESYSNAFVDVPVSYAFIRIHSHSQSVDSNFCSWNLEGTFDTQPNLEC